MAFSKQKAPQLRGFYIAYSRRNYPSLFSSNLALISAKAPKSPNVDFSTLA
jgi:hypothetical protein